MVSGGNYIVAADLQRKERWYDVTQYGFLFWAFSKIKSETHRALITEIFYKSGSIYTHRDNTHRRLAKRTCSQIQTLSTFGAGSGEHGLATTETVLEIKCHVTVSNAS